MVLSAREGPWSLRNKCFWLRKKSSQNWSVNFWIFFDHFCDFLTLFDDFCTILGHFWYLLELLFVMLWLATSFVRFWQYFSHISKEWRQYNVLKTLRLCIDLGFRHVGKIALCFKNMHRSCHHFSIKNWWKSSCKVRHTLFARKFAKKSLPGAPVGAKNRFFVDSGTLEGIQKLVKVGDTSCRKGSWKPCGSYFGRFSALFSILVPLFVNSGSILADFGFIFQ